MWQSNETAQPRLSSSSYFCAYVSPGLGARDVELLVVHIYPSKRELQPSHLPVLSGAMTLHPAAHVKASTLFCFVLFYCSYSHQEERIKRETI